MCSSIYSETSLTIHLRIQTGEKPFHPNMCEATFAGKAHLSSHLRTHTAITQSCNSQPLLWRVHIAALTEIVPHLNHRFLTHHAVTTCSTNTMHGSYFKGEHLVAVGVCKPFIIIEVKTKKPHIEVKPFHCNLCAATFSEKFLLARQFRIFTGEKPFSTLYMCEASFAQKATLTSHLRTHTGEKPFNGNIFEAAFV